MPYKDLEKRKAAKERYYNENREKYRNRKNERVAKFRIYIQELKESVPCKDCDIQYPSYIMDFDHVKGEKRYNIGSQLSHFSSLEDLQKEIDKCDIVCANCHRHRTWMRKTK